METITVKLNLTMEIRNVLLKETQKKLTEFRKELELLFCQNKELKNV